MPTTLRLLLPLILGLFGLQPVSYGYDAPVVFVSAAQNIVAASPERQAATAESAASVPLNFSREGGAMNGQANTREFSDFVAAESGPGLMYHYTTAPESSFEGGLWSGSSVTDKLYTVPVQAGQELGIPTPNTVLPIQNNGYFVPNSPPIVQPSFRYMGGGTDFTNPFLVPPSSIQPAIPLPPASP